jgi:hypothetical protein
MAGTDRTSAHAAVDPTMLSERLAQESPHYWLHLEAASRLEKYPGECTVFREMDTDGSREGLMWVTADGTQRSNTRAACRRNSASAKAWSILLDSLLETMMTATCPRSGGSGGIFTT